MDNPQKDGNELWRLLQGDTPDDGVAAAADAEAGAEAPAAPVDKPAPAGAKAPPGAASTKPPPGPRPPAKPFHDAEAREEPSAPPTPEEIEAYTPNPGSDNYIAQDSSGPGLPASTDTSQLQKILAADVDEDFEYVPAGQTVDDVDRAVREFNRGAMEVVHCRKHPDRESVSQCPVCQAFFCQECVIVRRGKLICRDCADAEYAPTEEEILAALELGQAAPAADTQLGEPERPEFEVGPSFLGGEGRPTNTAWQFFAWALDFVLTRGLLLAAVMLGGAILADNPHPLLHMLEGDSAATKQANVVSTLLFAGLPNGKWVSVLPLLLLIDFVYNFACLLFFNRTFGMSLVGMRVVTEWGDYAAAGACLARSAVYSLLLGAPAVIVGMFFPDYRGPHDLAAGTLVINYNGLKRVDAYETVPVKR